MTDYPEHRKLERLAAERLMLNEFLDWLSSQNVFLTRPSTDIESAPDVEDIPVTDHSALAARFLGIDEGRLEAERRAMIDMLHDLRAEQCA